MKRLVAPLDDRVVQRQTEDSGTIQNWVPSKAELDVGRTKSLWTQLRHEVPRLFDLFVRAIGFELACRNCAIACYGLQGTNGVERLWPRILGGSFYGLETRRRCRCVASGRSQLYRGKD